ncbi:MAG TPA: hypothetical protein VLZ81_10920 [Blastocatellia bacterium]|nr:hypothetical protein [Blastocatellia bacterium]
MQNNDGNDLQGTLCLFGGLALLVVGTGLIVSHPTVRKYLGQMGVTDFVQGAIPDLERYLKLRAM